MGCGVRFWLWIVIFGQNPSLYENRKNTYLKFIIQFCTKVERNRLELVAHSVLIQVHVWHANTFRTIDFFSCGQLLCYFLMWNAQTLIIFPHTINIHSNSMNSLFTHIVAHSTRHSFRPKTNNQSLKNLVVSWVKVIKNWTAF